MERLPPTRRWREVALATDLLVRLTGLFQWNVSGAYFSDRDHTRFRSNPIPDLFPRLLFLTSGAYPISGQVIYRIDRLAAENNSGQERQITQFLT